MRKQTKLVAVLSAAAMLAIGASMTSFAAVGWTEEDGTWVYYDKDGYKVTDTWKKSGSNWYYLDEDGYMAVSKLIENGDEAGNLYYVDETGKMVANQWVELDNEDYYDNSDDEEAETVWYYFQNSGKAYKTSGETAFKTINGKKYAFDENGKMLFGWVGANSERIKDGDASYKLGTYYCGDSSDGARVANEWRKLYVGNEGPDRADSEDDEYWFYFQNNGKKMYETVDSNGKVVYTKKVNGKTYAFDDLGIMISEWHEASETVASDVKGFFGDKENGARQKGWFKTIPSKNINSGAYNDDSSKWFYGDSDGKLTVSQMKTINGKKYGFNAKGEMLSGLYALEVDADNKIVAELKIDKENLVENINTTVPAGSKVYFFGTSEDGSMKTGTQNVEVDGETYQFAFGKSGSSKGQGLTTVETDLAKTNNIYYVNGKKIKASSDYRYQGVATDGTLVSGNDAIGCLLVNTSGSIMKSTKYTDSEGRIYTLDKTTHKVVSWEWKN